MSSLTMTLPQLAVYMQDDLTFTPRFSVILPVIQAEKSLLRAVKSVLKQTYPHLELIVVHDSADTETAEVLANIRDERLEVISTDHLDPNGARNTGISKASGQYISFIDGGEVWISSKLETEVQVLNRRYQQEKKIPICMIYSGYYAMNDQEQLIQLPDQVTTHHHLYEKLLSQEDALLASATTFHRDILQSVKTLPTELIYNNQALLLFASRQYPAYPTHRVLTICRKPSLGSLEDFLPDFTSSTALIQSFIESLRSTLSLEEGLVAKQHLTRSLLQRFLQAGQLEYAYWLAEDWCGSTSVKETPWLFSGFDGKLTWLTLVTGINWVRYHHQISTGLTQLVYGPWWLIKKLLIVNETQAFKVSWSFPALRLRTAGA
ncbi:MAG: glycosyltransferase [Vampirovibrio sp.]|nr:glycosyltransferase [Vampirovibrio sp.]